MVCSVNIRFSGWWGFDFVFWLCMKIVAFCIGTCRVGFARALWWGGFWFVVLAAVRWVMFIVDVVSGFRFG